ncbi:hypothetical protein ABK040_004045 [Willaertia magna]
MTDNPTLKEIKVLHSCDLDCYVSIRINGIDGELDFSNKSSISNNTDLITTPSVNQNLFATSLKDFITIPNLPSINLESKFEDLYVECGLYVQHYPICPTCITSYKSQNKSMKSWKEWIIFPVKYSELSLDTVLCVTIWDIYFPRKPVIVASSTFNLFNLNNRLLQTGIHKCLLWPNTKPDTCSENCKTPGEYNPDLLMRIEMESQRSENWYEDHLVWLRNASLKAVNRMRREGLLTRKGIAFLDIEFFDFTIPIKFNEITYNLLNNTAINNNTTATNGISDPYATNYYKEYINNNENNNTTATSILPNGYSFKKKNNEKIWCIDPEVEREKENPTLVKHFKLSMNLDVKSGISLFIHPDPKDKRKLIDLSQKTPLQEITMEEKRMLWKYRKWLQQEKRIGRKCLTKFLRSVDWSIEKEKREAYQCLISWTEIDTVDALFLLSKYFKGVEIVRNYAVSILVKAKDNEVLMILLQLVQALRYEHDMRTCKLADFLIERSESSFLIANDLYWYLTIECEDKVKGDFYFSLRQRVLAHFKNKNLENYIDQINRQKRLVTNLRNIWTELRNNTRVTRNVKIKALQTKIERINKGEENEWKLIFNDGLNNYLRIPVHPQLATSGILKDDATIFNSATTPIKISFITNNTTTKINNLDIYPIIFKVGDDLRQDQLIIQLIHLMDNILKNNGLDLKLTPYRVLACSSTEGFVECVTPSTPFAKIIETNQRIEVWLREQNANKQEKEFNEVLDNFMKSCAGYCVITYILGIGDRHLDNLLLTPDGKLFHIDFGFILGRDPKPFPPPMKLCKEMVEGMGGSKSERYKTFIKLCCTAYNILRENANLILNLFLLMIDANIPDIDFGIVNRKVELKISEQLNNILKVQERLKLELNNSEAIQFMQGIINESERALFQQVHDLVHRWATYWKD